jgi:hypothetical protein
MKKSIRKKRRNVRKRDMTKTYFDSDDEEQSDNKKTNKDLEVGKRQLVTRDGRHRSDIFTYVEGCFPPLYKKSCE